MDFNRKTLQLLKTSSHGKIGIKNFRRIFPEIAEQIESDQDSNGLDYWGRSSNFDEYESARIVDPKILSAIGRLANYPIRNKKEYHAGLLHTYGYLFSRLKTRFGYKRQRWTEKTIERGLNLKASTLSPIPESGTLLQNTTYVLSRISLQQFDPAQLLERNQTPSISEKAVRQLSVQRILEHATLDSGLKTVLISDLVKCKKPTANYSDLLIYSHHVAGAQKLITCFPISRNVKSELLKTAKENSTPIFLRFNAVVAGFPAEGCTGTREVTRLKL